MMRKSSLVVPASTTARAPAMTERELQAAIMELAATLGWLRVHFRPARTAHGWRTPLTGTPGFVDLVLVRAPRVLFVELKSAKGELTVEQGQWRAALEASPGVEYYRWQVGKHSLQEIAEKLR